MPSAFNAANSRALFIRKGTEESIGEPAKSDEPMREVSFSSITLPICFSLQQHWNLEAEEAVRAR